MLASESTPSPTAGRRATTLKRSVFHTRTWPSRVPAANHVSPEGPGTAARAENDTAMASSRRCATGIWVPASHKITTGSSPAEASRVPAGVAIGWSAEIALRWPPERTPAELPVSRSQSLILVSFAVEANRSWPSGK
jgi:hypothetical protein